MLLLDAMEDAPTLYVVLTARELLDIKPCRRHLAQLRKSCLKRWPGVRWARLAEFQKRGALHLNLMVKGVPVEDREPFHEHLVARWCERVDALPAGQWSDVIEDGVGVVQYVSLHFMKPSQAPPLDWRGHRYAASRDYLVRPAAVMREEARRSLRVKRLLYRGLTLDQAELEVANPPAFTLAEVLPLTAERPASLRGNRFPPVIPSARERAALPQPGRI